VHTFSELEQRQLASLVSAFVIESPPTLGLMGVSGVGKSSTINRLFAATMPISHTKACTKELSSLELTLKVDVASSAQQKINLRVVDAPGLGESISTDSKYLEMYKNHLDSCDVILWVMSAKSRAMVLDQQYLRLFMKHAKKMVFAVNQIDILPPMDWRESSNLPSNVMKIHAADIAVDRAEKLGEILGEVPEVVYYSAERGYNLEKLFNRLIGKIPKNRRWFYTGLKGFSFRDFYQISNN
jgi:uncharacterized protein